MIPLHRQSSSGGHDCALRSQPSPTHLELVHQNLPHSIGLQQKYVFLSPSAQPFSAASLGHTNSACARVLGACSTALLSNANLTRCHGGEREPQLVQRHVGLPALHLLKAGKSSACNICSDTRRQCSDHAVGCALLSAAGCPTPAHRQLLACVSVCTVELSQGKGRQILRYFAWPPVLLHQACSGQRPCCCWPSQQSE